MQISWTPLSLRSIYAPSQGIPLYNRRRRGTYFKRDAWPIIVDISAGRKAVNRETTTTKCLYVALPEIHNELPGSCAAMKEDKEVCENALVLES